MLLVLLLAGCQFFQTDTMIFSEKRYAIIVGINDYIYLSNDLQYCVSDADSVEQMLIDGGWNPARIKKITAAANESTNRFATKSALQNAIQNVPADTNTLFFYYSGHGDGGLEPEQAFIIPSDYSSANPDSRISSSELAEWLDSAPAANKIVVLDACYSGGFVDAGESLDAVPGDYQKNTILKSRESALEMFLQSLTLLERNFAVRSGSSGISAAPLVISAAGWDEESWEELSDSIGHGVFTRYLLDSALIENGFMKGDTDGDKILTALEAYRYAGSRILAAWNSGSSRDFLPHISGGLRDIALIDRRGL